MLRQLISLRRKEVFRVLCITLVLIALSSFGFAYFEGQPRREVEVLDAIWWSVVTMTTVGYGDLYPETNAGRYLVALPTMLLGISILGYVLSLFAQLLVELQSRRKRGLENLKMQQHVLIIHYPGEERILSVLKELKLDPKTQAAEVVLVAENLSELPPSLEEAEVRFVQGDPALSATLERADIQHAAFAIILARNPLDPHSDHFSLAAVLTCDALNPGLQSVVECVSAERVNLMKRAGAHSVVCVADFASSLLVQEAIDPGAVSALRQLVNNEDGEQIYVVPLKAHQAEPFGKVAAQLSEKRLLAIGFQVDGQISLNPEVGLSVPPDAELLCLGKHRLESIEIA